MIDLDRSVASMYFTLNHNYEIYSISDNDGHPIAYQREGDYISVQLNGVTQLKIIYAGFDPWYYSNAQGVFLPAYFSWYPMPGQKETFSGNNYIPCIDENDKNISVRAHSSLPLYTNLEKTEDGYCGTAKGLTIMGGLAAEKNDSSLRQVFLPLNGNTIELDIPKVNEKLAELQKLIESDSDLKLPPYYQIFSGPSMIETDSTKTVVFSDHIVCFGNLNEEKVAVSYWVNEIKTTNKKAQLRDALASYLQLSDEKRSEFVRFIRDNFRAKRFYGSSEKNDQFYYRLSLMEERLGKQDMIKPVIKYLQDDNNKADPLDFIEEKCAWREESLRYETT